MTKELTLEEYLELPVVVLYEPEPYYGCPRCESMEWGAWDPFAERLVYRCHECGARFRGISGIHHPEEEE